MHCIIDASFTASLLFPDEESENSQKIAANIAKHGAATPALWQLEIANLLLVAHRRKRITAAQQAKFLDAIDKMPINVQSLLTHQQRDTIMALAARHALTAYDASYLELAMRTKLPLATLDDQLSRAARAEGVSILP